MQTALRLIDVQQPFAARPYWRADGVASFLERTNALLAGCAARGAGGRDRAEGPLRDDPPVGAGARARRLSGRQRRAAGAARHDRAIIDVLFVGLPHTLLLPGRPRRWPRWRMSRRATSGGCFASRPRGAARDAQ